MYVQKFKFKAAQDIGDERQFMHELAEEKAAEPFSTSPLQGVFAQPSPRAEATRVLAERGGLSLSLSAARSIFAY